MVFPRDCLLFFAIIFCASCKTSVEGIKIGNTLSEQQDVFTHKKFTHLIKRTLNQDTAAFLELINFDCGGSAGCYDLGSVVAQIVNRLGEEDFLKMVSGFSDQQLLQVKNLIVVGLEYGYRLDDRNENKTIDRQFPKIDKILPK